MIVAESGATGDLSDLLVPTVTGALSDPKTQAAFNDAVALALESDRVKGAARPFLWEAAAWVGGAVLLASIVARKL